MNEQPQNGPVNNANPPEDQFYKPAQQGPQPSGYAGYNFANQPAPVQPQVLPAPVAPTAPTPVPSAAPQQPLVSPAPVQPPVDEPAEFQPPEPSYDEDPEVVSWEASEYVHHAKGAGWLVGFIAATLVLLAIAIFTQAWTFAVLIVVMGVALGIIAFRPPHTMHYALSHSGLQINDKIYDFSDFRAFGVIDDGVLYSVMLMPIKRLAPVVTIYFEEQDGEQIVDILGSYLPMEDLQQDPFDKLMRRLRF